MIRTFENIVKTIEEHKAIWLNLQELKKEQKDNYLTSCDEEKRKIALKIKKAKKQLKKSFKNL
jgi:hypothetical protein